MVERTLVVVLQVDDDRIGLDEHVGRRRVHANALHRVDVREQAAAPTASVIDVAHGGGVDHDHSPHAVRSEGDGHLLGVLSVHHLAHLRLRAALGHVAQQERAQMRGHLSNESMN